MGCITLATMSRGGIAVGVAKQASSGISPRCVHVNGSILMGARFSGNLRHRYGHSPPSEILRPRSGRRDLPIMASVGSEDKEIVFIRHGVTEMNEHLGRPGKSWGSPGFVDPGLYDTRLTIRGVAQAKRLGQEFLRRDPEVDLLCCSPLTRALETATFAFADGQVSESKRTVVSPLCAERLYLSSDMGRTAAELMLSFPNFDFNGIGDAEEWWYQPDDVNAAVEWRPQGEYVCPGEPEEAFEARLCLFKQWLLEQPEDRIAVVAHWGVIRALTGRSLDNCEVLRVNLGAILDKPLLVAV